MKNLILFFCLNILAAFSVRAETVVTTTTTVVTDGASSTSPQVSRVIVNPRANAVAGNESELYHRRHNEQRIYNGSPVYAVGAGVAAGALLWNSGYRHGRHRRYRHHRYHW